MILHIYKVDVTLNLVFIETNFLAVSILKINF